jgi:hypothetical protein
MFPINVKASEQVALLDQVNPASQAAGSVTTAWVSAQYFNKFLALVQVGAFGASATVDANIQQAQDGSGTGAKAIGSGRAITQMLAAGGNNKQATIDLDAQELDVSNGFCFVKLTITVGVAATLVSGSLYGFIPRDASAALFNNASVVQQVG